MNEGGWGILEIVVVLILVVAILDRLFGTPDLSKPATADKTKTTTPDTRAACDKIAIRNPKSLEKISVQSQGVTVTATISACASLLPAAPDTFIVSVVDAQGLVIAEPYQVTLSSVEGGWSINHFAIFSSKPKAGTGYIIITRINNQGIQVADGGARLPIRFVNQ